jgi:hypothetical protein
MHEQAKCFNPDHLCASARSGDVNLGLYDDVDIPLRRDKCALGKGEGTTFGDDKDVFGSAFSVIFIFDFLILWCL